MAEEDLKKAIVERIEKEREDILGQARREADKVIEEARAEATSLRNKHLEEIQRECLLKKRRGLSQANLEAKRQIREARERKIGEVFSQLGEDLKAIHRDGKRYRSIFSRLLREALDMLNTQVGSNLHSHEAASLKIKVNPLDSELASDALRDLGVKCRVETTESVTAGVAVSDAEENVIILNTFASRLEKLMPELRKGISKILFGEPAIGKQ